MNIDQIQANKPVGATHYFSHTKNYLKNTNGIWYVWNHCKWLRVKQMTYLFSIIDTLKPL